MKFVRTQKDLYRLYLNTPATFRLMGDVLWKRVLDLGCGEGFHSRLMAKKGAKVVGVEPSDLIEYAIATENRNTVGIHYHRARAEALADLRLSPFDLVVAFMVFNDIGDLNATIKGAASVLEKNGHLVFSIFHPMSNCMGDTWKWNGSANPDSTNPDYFNRRIIRVTWAMEGLEMPFDTLMHHRPLSDYIDCLQNNGFAVINIVEPYPTDEQIKGFPALERERLFPNFLHIKARYLGQSNPQASV